MKLKKLAEAVKIIIISLLVACVCVSGFNAIKKNTEEQTANYNKCLQENKTSLCKDLYYY